MNVSVIAKAEVVVSVRYWRVIWFEKIADYELSGERVSVDTKFHSIHEFVDPGDGFVRSLD